MFQKTPTIFGRVWASLSIATWQIVISTIITIFVLDHFILGDVDDRIPLQNGTTDQISLVANFLDIDATLRTVTVDWFPLAAICPSPELVVDLFTDSWGPRTLQQRLYSHSTPQTAAPYQPQQLSFFRTAVKLTGMGSSSHTHTNSRSLQAYPYDKYLFQISMFAQVTGTNASVALSSRSLLEFPFLDKASSSDDEQGILLTFTVSRSTAVIGLVLIMVVANWLVTVAFLWITIAAFMWEENIVAEMFVLPIGALFAFTAVRANLPGAPAGFGAVVDYYGILPNLGLITLFSAILLFGILSRRILAASRSRSPKKVAQDDAEQSAASLEAHPEPNFVNQTILELRAAVAGLQDTVNAMGPGNFRYFPLRRRPSPVQM
ncbi:hypothetical protein B0H13DRAFT_1914229 [Mycena leptocephala]|nr:hypothetical protein B0H13DRAFT_1914229 [Mycena leptocephala]